MTFEGQFFSYLAQGAIIVVAIVTAGRLLRPGVVS
jgi:hypothetical protein